MKTTGITRRIDELGRIVIPKEIRKNMHLKTGELLEIFLQDQDTIMLKKHAIISKNNEFLKQYINVLASKIKADVYVTSLDEIAFSSVEDLVGTTISTELEDLMMSNLNFNNLDKVKLTEHLTLENPLFVAPLSPNGDLSGLFIVNFKGLDIEENKQVIKFSTAFLEEYLENE